MHQNSLDLMRDFVERYRVSSGTIVDVGSQDLNGTYRGLFPPTIHYIGADIVEGKNVDVIMDSPRWRELPEVDCVISGQTLEHVEDVPKLMGEIYRIMKDGGLLCIIAPSAGPSHEYPIWTIHFTDDSMSELVTGAGFEVLECLTSDILPFKDVRCIARKRIRDVEHRYIKGARKTGVAGKDR